MAGLAGLCQFWVLAYFVLLRELANVLSALVTPTGSALKIGADNISGGASGQRRVGISPMNVEAGVSAQAVAKLTETLVPHTQGESSGFTDSIVVLPIGGTFPSPILAIQ